MTTVPESLDEVLEDIWSKLARGKADRRSAFHTPTVCSVDHDAPAPRIMVLREVDRAAARLRFHTDFRSPKRLQFDRNPKVSILGYDPSSRIQITVAGLARVVADGPAARAAWDASALTSRRCYLAFDAPGSHLDEASSGLPLHLLERSPTLEESEPGWSNFAILLVQAEQLEWLKLTACGNRRARFTRNADSWTGQWLHP